MNGPSSNPVLILLTLPQNQVQLLCRRVAIMPFAVRHGVQRPEQLSGRGGYRQIMISLVAGTLSLLRKVNMISFNLAITLIAGVLLAVMVGCAPGKPIIVNDLQKFSGEIISTDRTAKTMTIQVTEGEPVTVKMYDLADYYETELVGRSVGVQFHRSFSLSFLQ
ncbi:MAG: hypothetical protein KKD01_14875 [Proteobacteria bacterium]|nr:hypothetical protein [Pseudomonadota bacterium]MBU1417416.1 hypothetical protein [Pseudomonadota bacterium]MBU1456005.1 hypothetical protein [Pseudomonadota bacterium]